MASYIDSIHAPKELLSPSDVSQSSCSITKVSQNISHLSNGIEYCLIEITCDDGILYGIRAYGEEAATLHREAFRHYHHQPLQKVEGKEEGQIMTPFAYSVSNWCDPKF